MDADRSVESAGDDAAAVRGERDGEHASRVPFELMQELAVVRRVDPGRAAAARAAAAAREQPVEQRARVRLD
jgi:hypothetical protein